MSDIAIFFLKQIELLPLCFLNFKDFKQSSSNKRQWEQTLVDRELGGQDHREPGGEEATAKTQRPGRGGFRYGPHQGAGASLCGLRPGLYPS